jgi:lysophospholipase L1-like esterase
LKLRGLFYFAVANAVMFTLAFAAGELYIRSYVEGGLRAGIESVLTRRTPDSYLGTGGLFVHDAELGYTYSPEHEGINSLGIRNREIVVPKPAGLFRVVVLGDSVAAAADGFVTMFAARAGGLRPGPVEVINAAVSGYTTYQERRLLERHLDTFAPDLVVLEYCLNDNHRILHHLTGDGKWLITQQAKKALLAEGGGLLARASRSSYLLLEINRRLFAKRWMSQGTFPWDNREDFFVAWRDDTWPDFEEHLVAMRDLLASAGSRMAIVAVPFEPQLRADLVAIDRDYVLKPQRKLAEAAARAGVPLLDLYDSFAAEHEDGLYIDDGIHLVATGHRLAAKRLFEFVRDEGLMR